MAITSIEEGINGIENAFEGALGNPLLTAIGGAVVGSAVAGTLVYGITSSKAKSRKSSSKRKSKKITHTSRGWAQDRKRRSRQKWEVRYWKKHHGKKSRKSRKGVYHTKNGQPYIILASGKAKFIKKRR